MGMGRRKTITDAALLDVARQVFVEEGFGASTKEIARRAGVSEGVLYQRFASKDELFFAAMIPPAVDVNRIFRKSRLKGRALVEKLTLAMLEYNRATLPVLLPLMLHPRFQFEEFARRHPDSPLFLLRRELVNVVLREREAGRIGRIDPGGAALLIWSTALAVAFFERLGAHHGKFHPTVIRATVRCLWDGLKPQQSP
jgi:AcrR family transcriptional regulator